MVIAAVVVEVVALHGSFFKETSGASFSAGEAESDVIPQGSMDAPMVLGGGGGCSVALRPCSGTPDLAVGLPKSKSNKSLDGFAFCCSSALN